MINIIFLTFLFNCTKINLKDLIYIDKHPMSSNLIKAIKEAADIEIEKELKDLSNYNGAVKTIDIRQNNRNFLMVLLQDYAIEYKLKNGETERDIIKKKIRIFKKYLQEFAGIINDSDKEGKTILFYAIDSGIGEIVTTLINVPNIDLEHLNKDRLSPLNYCILNDTSIFNYLYSTFIGLDTNYLSKFKMLKNKKIKGDAPLLVACLANKPDIVRKLLDQGVEVDVENEHNTKAIWISAINGHEEVVEELLAKGAKHLSKKDIILYETKTVMGLVIKAFLQKSLDAGMMTANLVAKSHGIVAGVPLGLDLSVFENSDNDIDKKVAYNEVRRIYKKGEWITRLENEEPNIHIILEYIELISNVVSKLNKKYMKLDKVNKFNKNPSIFLKIFALDKMNGLRLSSNLEEAEIYTQNLINSLNVFYSSLNATEQDYLKKFKDDLFTFIRNYASHRRFRYKNFKLMLSTKYEELNKKKDAIFQNYIPGIPSFYKLELLLNSTIISFKNFIGEESYEALLQYLHSDFQRRTRMKKSLKSGVYKIKKGTKRTWEALKNLMHNVKHTNKVSRLNSLMMDDENNKKKSLPCIYIEGNASYKEVDFNENYEHVELPKINFKGRRFLYKNFINYYKELLRQKNILFNFIDELK